MWKLCPQHDGASAPGEPSIWMTKGSCYNDRHYHIVNNIGHIIHPASYSSLKQQDGTATIPTTFTLKFPGRNHYLPLNSRLQCIIDYNTHLRLWKGHYCFHPVFNHNSLSPWDFYLYASEWLCSRWGYVHYNKKKMCTA